MNNNYFFSVFHKMPTKSDMKKAVMQDYPHLPTEMIDLVLDLYESDPDYIERLCKEEKKKMKRVPTPKTQLTLEEFERLHAVPKAAHAVKQEDVDQLISEKI